MEEIGEEEIFDDFAEALQLRPLERRREFTDMGISMAGKMEGIGTDRTGWRHVIVVMLQANGS